MTNTTSTAPTYVDPFPGRKGDERIVDTCGDCRGSGLYDAPTGYTDGKGRPYCFSCNGSGRISYLVSSARAKARRHVAEAKAQIERAEIAGARWEAEQAERAAKVAAFTAEHEAVVAWLRANAEGSEFAASLLRRVDEDGDLSEAQVAAVERILADDALRAAAEPVVEGRRVVEGLIVSTKEQATGFGTTWKMLVQEPTGARVWGSIPSALSWDAEKGTRVRFTATVSRSEKDAAFGFFSRPTKAEVVA